MSEESAPKYRYEEFHSVAEQHTRLTQTRVILLTALVYLPTLLGDLVWDDHLLLDPARLQSVESLFSAYLPSQDGSLPPYFRPLVTLSFWLDAHVHGLNPALLHAGNWLIHLLNTWLMMRIARQLFGVGEAVAALGGLLFALHPMRVESVAWIAGRPDLLACCFSLLCVRVGLAGLTPSTPESTILRGQTGETILYGAALLCKESAFPLPLFTAWNRFRADGWRHALGLPLLLSLATAVGYGCLRMLSLESAQVRSFTGEPLLYRVLGSGRIVLAYLERWLLPRAPCAHWELPPLTHASDAQTWSLGVLGLSVMLLCCGYVLYQSRKPFSQSSGLPVAGLVWMFLFLTPVLGWIPIDEQVAERYFYLPSVGLSWTLAWMLMQGWERLEGVFSRSNSPVHVGPSSSLLLRCILPLTVLVWLSFCGWHTVHGIRHWSSDARLFMHEVECAPESGQAWMKLGEVMRAEGQLSAATQALESAIRLEPGLMHAYALLAALALERGEPDTARDWLSTAPAQGRRSADQLGLLARVQLALGEAERAYLTLAQASALAPDRPDFQQDLALAALKLGRFAEAEAALTRLILLGVTTPESYTNRGIARMAQAKRPEALDDFWQAYRRGGEQPQHACNLGRALLELDHNAEGCEKLRSCLAGGQAPPRVQDLTAARCPAP